jgi:hypothetical protein
MTKIAKCNVVLFTLLINAAAYSAPELVAYWPFESTSANTYTDATGHGYAINSSATGVTAGISGNAINLTGDYTLTVTNSMNNFNFTAFTIETWFYSNRSSPAFGDQILFTNTTYAPGLAEGFTLKIDSDGRVVLSLAELSSTGWSLAESDSVLPTRKWHHIVGTYDGSDLRVYLNGRLAATTTVGAIYPLPHDNAHVGCGVGVGETAGEFLLDGKLDEMKVYNYALSALEILDNYNRIINPAIVPTKKELVAYWPFEENMGSMYFYDITGHGYNINSSEVGVTAGISGNAASLPGDNYTLTVLNSYKNFNFSTFTIETWFYSNKPSPNPQGQILFTHTTYAPGIAEGLTLKIGSRGDVVLAIAQMSGIAWDILITDSILTNRTWHHIVGTYDGNYLRIFIDGKLSKAKLTNPTYLFPRDNAHVGCSVPIGSGTSESCIDGKLDEMKIYNYALLPDTILSHFQSPGIPPILTRHKVNFGMQNVTGKPGDDVWVPIYITNFDDALTLTASDFSLFIDTNYVSFVDAIVDSGIAFNWIIEKNATAKESIKIVLGGANHSIGYSEGELLRCRYHIKQTVADTGFTDIRFKYANVNDDTVLNITTTPGKISFSKPAVTFGDVTGNGIVSAMDGAKVLQFVVGALPIPDASVPNWSVTVADVSGDKTISSYDAALIFKYSVGLISRFPAEPSKMLPKRMISNSTSSTAQLSLVLMEKSVNQTVYQLRGNNLAGFCAGDFTVQYDPAAIQIDIGEIRSNIRSSSLYSQADGASNRLRIALATSDGINGDSMIGLITLTVPPVADAKVRSALVLKTAQINEGNIPCTIAYETDGGFAHNNTIELSGANIALSNHSELTIKTSTLSRVSVRIFDVKGCALLTKAFPAGTGMVTLQLNTLPAGMYLLKVNQGTSSIMKPLVVQ